MNTLQLAQVAYLAYGEAVGGKNFRGDPLPQWSELGEVIQGAWCRAAEAVANFEAPVPSNQKEVNE